jgi:arginine decarboxylase
MNLPGLPSLAEFTSEFDVTELDGLDDLSYPQSSLKNLEDRIARLYKVKSSIISVSGGSGGLLAGILAVARRGTEFLIPRNAHRAVVNALVLSGLKPCWYEPIWNEEFGFWGAVEPSVLEDALAGSNSVAGVLVVSPTYIGEISEIEKLKNIAHRHGVPLIVDEAQGAHLLAGGTFLPVSACASGADLVIHSFHKTLNSMTQTGVVHVVSDEYVDADDVRNAMRLISTSSPNYVLLASIEQTIIWNESEKGREKLVFVAQLAVNLRNAIRNKLVVYSPQNATDPFHVLICSPSYSGAELDEFLRERGIFCEAVLGAGCLLLLGAGTEAGDIDFLISALAELPELNDNRVMISKTRPQPLEQIMSPREAFFAPSELVAAADAVGRIASETFAPCPPGMPLCVPGSRVGADVSSLAQKRYLRVLLESN